MRFKILIIDRFIECMRFWVENSPFFWGDKSCISTVCIKDVEVGAGLNLLVSILTEVFDENLFIFFDRRIELSCQFLFLFLIERVIGFRDRDFQSKHVAFQIPSDDRLMFVGVLMVALGEGRHRMSFFDRARCYFDVDPIRCHSLLQWSVLSLIGSLLDLLSYLCYLFLIGC